MTYETKDSGEREEFDSGMVRDTNKDKPRFDLLLPKGVPYDAQMLTRWAGLMARGAAKYDERNWEKAEGQEELDRAKESAFRHFIQWMNGEHDEDHAAAIMFNVTEAEYIEYKMEDAPSENPPKILATDYSNPCCSQDCPRCWNEAHVFQCKESCPTCKGECKVDKDGC